MKLSYPVCYVTAPDDTYWCFVPDLGLFDQGDTMDELHTNLKEGVLYAITSELEEGHPIPTPSQLIDWKIQKELQDIMNDPNNKEAHLQLFSIDYTGSDKKGGKN